MERRAAIVGVDALTAFGGLEATWTGVSRSDSALQEVRGFDGAAFGFPRAAQLPGEDEPEGDDPADRILGLQGRVFEAAARTAHDRARGAEIPREEVGLYVATGMVDSHVEDLAPAVLASRGPGGTLDLARFFANGFRSIHPLWPLSMLNNVGVGQVAMGLDVRGDNLVLASEADAGVRVFAEALGALREGAVRMAVVGGVSERVCPASLARRRLRGVATPPGEGGAVVVLEHPDSARARGVAPLAYLSGVATTFGPGAAERAAAGAASDAGAGADVRAWPFLAETTGDLGAGAPALAVALLATFLSRWVLPPGRTAPRALVTATSSAGGAGALVVERAPDPEAPA